MSTSYDVFTGLLKVFPLPSESLDGSISFDHSRFGLLKEKYPIDEVAGGGDDFAKAKNLLYWVSAHVTHKGDYRGDIAKDALSLLDYAYDKGAAQGINCVCLATILTDCLLSIGIKARTVYIMPCSPYDFDNHCVTHAYIESMGKWVMLDPTLSAYFMNEEGLSLSLFELREHLANQEAVVFNDKVKYNDEGWNDDIAKEFIEYFAKNLFYFQTYDGDSLIMLSPQGFDPNKAIKYNNKYRAKFQRDNPRLKEWGEA